MLETSKVSVVSTGTALQAKAESRGFTITFDEPVESGGGNTGMNPVEGLLCALGGCQTIATMIFAQMKGVELSGVSVDVEGDLDPDGFMGKAPDVRNGQQEVRVTLRLSGSDKEQLRELAALAEERCPVGDCLKNPVPLRTEIVVD